MNSVRVPVVILVLIIIAICAWYFVARQDSVPTAAATTIVATSTPSTNSAPVSAAPTTLNAAAVSTNVVGTWQSTDDPNYSIIITASGKWTDTYGTSGASSTSETGTYELFTTANPDKDFTGVLVPGVVYVKVAEGTSILYFSVLEASGSQLQLSYLDRGNTLSFAKVQ